MSDFHESSRFEGPYLLTYGSCTIMRVEPVFFTSCRHPILFCASSAALSMSAPARCRSSAMTSRQRVLGAPRGRLHPAAPGSKSRMARVGWSGGSLRTWPSHRTRRWAASVDAGGWRVRWWTSTLVTCWVQWIPSILRSALVSKPSMRNLRVEFRAQVSAPHSSTDRTHAL